MVFGKPVQCRQLFNPGSALDVITTDGKQSNTLPPQRWFLRHSYSLFGVWVMSTIRPSFLQLSSPSRIRCFQWGSVELILLVLILGEND